MIALSDLSNDVCWSKEWWEGQGYVIDKPIIYQDNKSTIHLVTEGGGKMRPKQMRALQASVKQGVDDNEYAVDYRKTDDMISDFYTKPTGGGIFRKFSSVVMGTIRDIHPKVIAIISGTVNRTNSRRGTDMRTAGVRRDNTHRATSRMSRKTHTSARSAPGGVPFPCQYTR